MDSSRKTLLFFGISLLLVSSASAATLQVEGLTAKNVNATFVDNNTIRFTTSYLNKSLTPKQVFVPNATSHAVVDWSFSRETWDGNNGVSSLNYQYGLASNYEYPSPETSALLGQNSSVAGLPANYYQYSDSFYSNESSSRGTVFQSSFSEVVEDSQNQPIGNATWNITVKAHYEHLIINYELIYNDTVQDQFQDIYSGEEPVRVPFSDAATQHIIYPSQNVQKQSLTYDNLYDNPQNVTLAVAIPEKDSIRKIDLGGLSYKIWKDGSYQLVKNQVKKADLSDQILVDNQSGYSFKFYNVTIPRNSTQRLTSYVNTHRQGEDSVYMWVIGSAGGSTLLYDTSSFDVYDLSKNIGWRVINISSKVSEGNILKIPYNNTIDGFENPNSGFFSSDLTPIRIYNVTNLDDGSGINISSNIIGGTFKLRDSTTSGYAEFELVDNITKNEKMHFVFGIYTFDDYSTSNKNITVFSNESDKVKTSLKIYGYSTGFKDGSWELKVSKDRDIWSTPSWYPSTSSCGGTVGFYNVSADNFVREGSENLYQYSLGQYCDPGYAAAVVNIAQTIDSGVDFLRLDYTYDVGTSVCDQVSDGMVEWHINGNDVFSVCGGGNTYDNYEFSLEKYSPPYQLESKTHWESGDKTYLKFDQVRPYYTRADNTEIKIDSSIVFSKSNPYNGTFVTDRVVLDKSNENITYSGTGGTVIWTDKYTNSVPKIKSSKILINKSSLNKRLIFELDPIRNPDISDYSGLSSALKFTNTTLKSSISLPFTSTINVSDWNGAFSNDKAVDLSKTDSGVQEEDFDHSEDTQRLNRTYAISNNAASPINYTLQLDLPGTVIQGQMWTGTISSSSSVAHTAITEGDWISEAVSKLRQDKSSTSNLGTQYVYKAKNVTETLGIKFTGVNVSTPSISGNCSNCGKRNVDVPASSTVTEYYNSTGDWIVNETRGTFILGVNTSFHHTLDKQKLFNQTNLTVSNTRGFTFQQVNLSSICSLDTKADVPAGTTQITTKCSNETVSGDWIVHEENYTTEYRSGEIVIGSNIKQNYTAVQKIYAENNRSSHGFSVDYASKISSRQKCSLMNQTVQTLSASSAANKSFYKDCEPGEEVSWDRTKTDTGDYYKYNYTAQFKVFTEITSENTTLYGIPIDRLPNWGERDPDKTKIKVDGSSKDLKVLDKTYHGTEYKVIRIGRNHTESSVHEGTHTASLVYYEPKETDTGSTVGGGGGGTTKVVKKVVNESESGFKWTLSVLNGEGNEVGNTISLLIGPGEEVNYTMVVANTGSRNVTLTIDCVSQDGVCSWIDTSVDRIKLDPTGFNKTSFRVTGEVPENVSGGKTYNFRIQVTDPSFQPGKPGGAAVVSFKLSTNKLGALFTRLTDKLDDTFTVEPPFGQGKKISGIPIVFVSMLAGIGVFAALAAVASAVATGKEMRSVGIIVSFVVAVSVFITVTLGI